MRACLVLWLCLGLGSGSHGASLQESLAPVVRMSAGSGRLFSERSVQTLDARTGAVHLAGKSGRVECGAATRVDLAWRGLASATVTGPAAFELAREPGLLLEVFGTAEVEVRRGTLALELAGLGSLELAAGAVRVRCLPDGSAELLNRGGRVVEFWLGERRPLAIGPGQSLRLAPPDTDL
jgi:hypothetical protein